MEGFVEDNGDPVVRKKRPNKCDECGKKFGMVRHRWWPSTFCSKKCLRKWVVREGKRTKEFWKKLNKKQDGSDM